MTTTRSKSGLGPTEEGLRAIDSLNALCDIDEAARTNRTSSDCMTIRRSKRKADDIEDANEEDIPKSGNDADTANDNVLQYINSMISAASKASEDSVNNDDEVQEVDIQLNQGSMNEEFNQFMETAMDIPSDDEKDGRQVDIFRDPIVDTDKNQETPQEQNANNETPRKETDGITLHQVSPDEIRNSNGTNTATEVATSDAHDAETRPNDTGAYGTIIMWCGSTFA